MLSRRYHVHFFLSQIDYFRRDCFLFGFVPVQSLVFVFVFVSMMSFVSRMKYIVHFVAGCCFRLHLCF